MLHHVRRAALIAALSIVGMAGVAAPAVAAPTIASPQAAAAFACPTDAYACLFDKPNGQGDRYVLRTCDPNGFELPRYWWDKTESIWSGRGHITLVSYPRSQLGHYPSYMSYNLPSQNRNKADVAECLIDRR